MHKDGFDISNDLLIYDVSLYIASSVYFSKNSLILVLITLSNILVTLDIREISSN